ncbi:MAG: hypothetical protein ABJC66_02385 [Gammaproteobacteria bacterium]
MIIMPILMPRSTCPQVGAAIRLMCAAIAVGCALLSGCQKASPGMAAPAPKEANTAAAGKPEAQPDVAAKGDVGAAGKEKVSDGVTLTPEQVRKLGIVAQEAAATKYTPENAGYGVVVVHEAIATAVAELVTAQATERQSQSMLSRTKRLSGTPGAMSADVEEAAAHQAAVDTAALTLTTQKLSSTFGLNPPWKIGANDAILRELASGRIKLLRVTFPLGALSGGAPASLRATRIGAAAADRGWMTHVVWDAPADASVPGRSFFALLKGSDAGEGERLMVWAPVGEAVSGAIVPAAAVVMSEGKYWCYVEKKPGNYVRAEIDTGTLTAEGYFVTDGVMAGDKVVLTAAGQLLAKESNSDSEPD